MNFPKSGVVLTPTSIEVYKLYNDKNPSFIYPLTQLLYDEDVQFSINQLKLSKKPFIKSKLHLLSEKFHTIEKKVTNDVFFNKCKVLFGQRDIKKDLMSNSTKRECIILCFPNNLESYEMMKIFDKLIFKLYTKALEKEDNFYNINILGKHRSSATKYYSPFMLNKEPLPSKIATTYMNINKYGVTFNKQRVINKDNIK